jgi:hypothetical protein
MFCPHCGKEISENQAFCQFCGEATAIMATAPGTGRAKTTWEEEGTQWTIRGLVDTLKGSLFNPSDFFRKMDVTGGIAGPMLYAMIVGMIGIMLFNVWQIVLNDPYTAYIAARGGSHADIVQGAGTILSALFLPFMIIIGLFLVSGMFHLLLMLTRGANRPFEATFRVAAYSSGALIFLAVPYCGMFVVPFWYVTHAIIGLREAHSTTGGKATFAVLFPLLLCCVIVSLFFLLVLGTVAASFGTLPHQPWK